MGSAAALLALLTAACVAFLDVPIARAIAELPAGVHGFFRTGTDWLDVLSGKVLSNSAMALVLILLALGAWTHPASRMLAKLLILVALSNQLSHAFVGLLKPVFGRLRPFRIVEAGWGDQFFAGGRSFPSGHTAFYFGLCLPFAWAWPRWRIPLLLPALFIAVARVLENDHFAGDVLGALAITSGTCAMLIAAFQRYAKLEGFG
jgi:membrane-associated phospholipid phosphatase